MLRKGLLDEGSCAARGPGAGLQDGASEGVGVPRRESKQSAVGLLTCLWHLVTPPTGNLSTGSRCLLGQWPSGILPSDISFDLSFEEGF